MANLVPTNESDMETDETVPHGVTSNIFCSKFRTTGPTCKNGSGCPFLWSGFCFFVHTPDERQNAQLQEHRAKQMEASDKYDMDMEDLKSAHKEMVGALDDIHGKVKESEFIKLQQQVTDIIAGLLIQQSTFMSDSTEMRRSLEKTMMGHILALTAKLDTLTYMQLSYPSTCAPDLCKQQQQLPDTWSTRTSPIFVFGQPEQQAQEHKANMEEGLELLEKQVSDTADKHQHTLQTLESSYDQLNGKVKGEKDTRDAHQTTLNERFEYLENAIQPLSAISGLGKASSQQHNFSVSETIANAKYEGDKIKLKIYPCDDRCATMNEQFEYMDKLFGESSDEHDRHLELAEDDDIKKYWA